MSPEGRARESLVGYWTRFADEARLVAGAPALANARVGLVGPNAAYPTRSEQVEDLDLWYASLGRPGVLVVAPSSEVSRAALAMGFRHEGELEVIEVLPVDYDESVWVEQVPWSLGGKLGAVIARAEGLPEWGPALGSEIARVLQEDAGATAYLALDGDRPVGALVLVEGAAHLRGALDQDPAVGAALLGRAVRDSGAAVTTSARADRVAVPSPRAAARFVVLARG